MLATLFDATIRLISFLFGTGVVLITLNSILRTYVLARSARDPVAGFVLDLIRKGFVLVARRTGTYQRRDQIMALYAPTALFVLPLNWLAMITLGYAFIYWGLGVDSAEDAFIISGSSLLTLGFATTDDIFQIILEFTEASIGLLLVALIIAYLPTMYAAFSRRESLVNLTEVYAGTPPTASEIILRHYRNHGLDQLNTVWDNWRIWFAEVEESHTSLAPLVFFRSTRPERSWITTAGAVLDAAAIYASSLNMPPSVQAPLCIRSGYLALRYIADFFDIGYDPSPAPDNPISITQDEFNAVYDLMLAEGVPLKPDREECWRNYAGWRVNYDAPLLELAALTMAPYAPWSSDRSRPHFVES